MSQNKYPDLQKFVGIQKVYGIIIIVVSFIAGGVFFITGLFTGNMGGGIVGILIAIGIIFAGLLFGNFVIAIGEFAQVAIDIEENTSNNAK
ncbi:MAG: hypothetical protein WCJ46_04965 [bacterium]